MSTYNRTVYRIYVFTNLNLSHILRTILKLVQ